MQKFTFYIACLFIWTYYFCVACGVANAQAPNPANYHAFTPQHKAPFFTEDFDNNAQYWEGVGIDDELGAAQITGGYCYLEAAPASSMIIANAFAIDESRDFEIEASLRFVRARSFAASNSIANSLITLSWGLSLESNEQLAFSFTPAHMLSIQKLATPPVSIVSPQKISHFHEEDFNKLTIRKFGSHYYFFVNEVLVGEYPYQPLPGNGFIFTAGSNLVVQIDFLCASYLLQPAEKNLSPRLAIDSLEHYQNNFETEEASIRITGTATDEDGIQSLTINGQTVSLQNHRFTSEEPLIIGKNLIKIEAVDVSGIAETLYLEVIRTEPKARYIASQQRLAIIIGNAAYQNATPLKNPIHDAEDMAATLQTLDFTVKYYHDLDYEGMREAIRQYRDEIDQYDVTLFFYAGHGIQVDQKNYLLPVDAQCKEKKDVAFEAIEAEMILSLMETHDGESLHLLVLDACRNNPFLSWERGGSVGLATMRPPSGTLIAFSTSPGAFASDGNGQNGLYTGELLNQLSVSQRIEDIFINTRLAVERKSNGRQSPWELARLRGKYYLK